MEEGNFSGFSLSNLFPYAKMLTILDENLTVMAINELVTKWLIFLFLFLTLSLKKKLISLFLFSQITILLYIYQILSE